MTLIDKFRDPLVQFGILFSFFISILLYNPALAAPATNPSTPVQTVQSLEDTLFAIHYDQEPLENRVSRLEETVFGQKQSGPSMDARIQRLKSALSPASLGPLSPTPQPKGDAMASNSQQGGYNAMASGPYKALPNRIMRGVGSVPDTGSAMSPTSSNNGSNPTSVSRPEPGETDYPTVTQMELKRFGKSYTQEDITQRLNRLEQDVFKVPQKGGSLVDRVDNLKMVVLGDIETGPAPSIAAVNDPMSYVPPGSSTWPTTNAYSQPSGSSWGGTGPYNPGTPSGVYAPLPSTYPNPGPIASNSYTPPAYSNTGSYAPQTYPQNTYPSGGAAASVNGDSPDVLAAITESEKQIIGHTYPSEPTSARLDRLESKVFKSTAPELPPAERIQRIIAVASAGSAPQSAKTRAKTTFQVLLPVILTLLPLILL